MKENYKQNPLYESYLMWLSTKLQKGSIDNGKYHLYRISETSFWNFKDRYNDNITFKEKIDTLNKCENRDIKINDILINGDIFDF